MPSREFETFSKLIEYRTNCPICSNELIYKISNTIFDSNFSNGTNLVGSLSRSFERALENIKQETIVEEFKPTTVNLVKINKLFATIDIPNNILLGHYTNSSCVFDLKIYCDNGSFPHKYEAVGDFSADDNYCPKDEIDETFSFNIKYINIYHEIYKVYNLFDNKEGNVINIINDYNINKTSFSITEANIDGSNKSYKEKRIDLVNDDYFKFENTKKVYSRINSIFLLADK